MYEKQQWEKVLNNIQRKSELDKSREFANQIMTRFQHLDRDRSRTERDAKKAAGTNNADKPKTVASSGVVKKDASSSLNAGVKRTIDEVGKGPPTSAAKKVSIGDVRNPMPNPNPPPKSAAPSVPARNGPSSSVGEKKSATTSSVGISTTGPPPTSTTATATAKKPASSGFFKSLSKPAEAAKAPTKFVLPESHPMIFSFATIQSELPRLTTVT